MIDAGLRHALSRKVLVRNAFIALGVGCILTAVNLSGRLRDEGPSLGLALRAAFNFLVPFVVSTLSAAANRPEAGR